jgi:hypothetical protein
VASIGGIWLTGELNESKISETTYSWMWNCLRIAIDTDMDNYVMEFWQHATQFYNYQLSHINPEYDAEGKQVNIEQQKERLEERRRFLEFTFALGGLLLYKNKYQLIGRMFRFTRSMPPDYPLLPDNMDEVFYWYFRFLNPYLSENSFIEHKYPFPGMEGVNAAGQIRYSILKYIAFLFVRQFSLVAYMVYQDPLRYPQIPKTQSEKASWLNNIEGMKKLVELMRHDPELLKLSGLDYITDEWCAENQKEIPEIYLEKFKATMSAAVENQLDNQPVSPEKVTNFKDSTEAFVTPALEELKRFNNPIQIQGPTQDLYIAGIRDVMDKGSFSDDQDVTNLNYDSFFGEELAKKIRRVAGGLFVRKISKRYLLREKDILSAISKLKLKDGSFVAVCFGKDLRKLYQQHNQSIPGNLRVIYYPYSDYDFVGDSVFILKEDDLPNVTFQAPDQNEIDTYALEELNHNFQLHASVLDLNQHPALRESLQPNHADKNLRRYVLLTVSVVVKFSFREQMKCVQLQVATEYRNRGLPNDLNEIEAY